MHSSSRKIFLLILPLSKSAQRRNWKWELEVAIDELGKYEAEEDSLMVMELAKKYTICGHTMLMGILSAFLKTTVKNQALSAKQGEG